MTKCHEWWNRRNKPPRLDLYGRYMGNGYYLHVNLPDQISQEKEVYRYWMIGNTALPKI